MPEPMRLIIEKAVKSSLQQLTDWNEFDARNIFLKSFYKGMFISAVSFDNILKNLGAEKTSCCYVKSGILADFFFRFTVLALIWQYFWIHSAPIFLSRARLQTWLEKKPKEFLEKSGS